MSHHAVDVPYAQESWTAAEADILRRYFTNLDGPVFALVNLPEVVKGPYSPATPARLRACAGCSWTSSLGTST